MGLLSIGNMAGRFVWSTTSDVVGRKRIYMVYLGVGAIRATPTKKDHPTPIGIEGFARARKIAGIILYVDPLPIPVSTNKTMNAAVNVASESAEEASTSTTVANAIAPNVAKVTRPPPMRWSSAQSPQA